jgi:Ni/Co efflux regulator RcnB
MKKTILTSIIIALVVVISVIALTSDDGDQVINETSTTSDQVVEKADNQDRNTNNTNTVRDWKTFGPSQELSSEFTFQFPQNWKAFVQGEVISSTVKLVPKADTDFEGNYVPPEAFVAEAGIWPEGRSYVHQYRTNPAAIQDGVTENSSEPITVNGYEGEVLELTAESSGVVMRGYVAEGEQSRHVTVLYLPDIGNNKEFTFLIDSNISNADQVFNRIVESLNNL